MRVRRNRKLARVTYTEEVVGSSPIAPTVATRCVAQAEQERTSLFCFCVSGRNQKGVHFLDERCLAVWDGLMRDEFIEGEKSLVIGCYFQSKFSFGACLVHQIT